MLNIADFMVDSDEDSDDAASRPPPESPKPATPVGAAFAAPQPLSPPSPLAEEPVAPTSGSSRITGDSEPRLHVSASAAPPPITSAGSQSFNRSPYEPVKSVPSARTTRSGQCSNASLISSRGAMTSHTSQNAQAPQVFVPSTSHSSVVSAPRDGGVHDELHRDAARHALELQEREELRQMGRGSDEDLVLQRGSSGLHNSSQGGSEQSKKKKFNKELFERLSKPLAIHQKYEEQKQLEKQQKAAEEAAEEQRRKDALTPITEVKWRVHTRRFQLSDLAQHNDQYLSS